MATTAENNIRAMEMIVEDLRVELCEAIAMYEGALEDAEYDPDYYNADEIEARKSDMEKKQRWYDEAKEELEREIMWSKF